MKESQQSQQPMYKERRKSLRDFFWNYPVNIAQFHRATRPLVYMIIVGLVGTGLFGLVTSANLSEMFARVEQESITEATVGTISTMNPIFLTQNIVVKDLNELVYDKLIYLDPDGSAQPGLATHWKVSDDLTRYTFTIGENRYWHDGEEVGSDDVIYTINKAVELAEDDKYDTVGATIGNVQLQKVNEKTVIIEVEEPNAIILQALSLYIMPEHIMSEIKDKNLYDYGSEVPPVGSGPYVVMEISPSKVSMAAFEQYPVAIGAPFYEYLVYPDVQTLQVAIQNNLVDIVSHLSASEMDFLDEFERFSVIQSLLKHRKKMIYFNNNEAMLDNFQVRGALASAIDKERLLEETGIDGNPVFSPISSDSWAFNKDVDFYSFDLQRAHSLFKEVGMKRDDSGFYVDKGGLITLTLSYLENPTNESIAQFMRESYKRLGIELKLRPLSYNSFVLEVIATRDFELLLLEMETTIDPDQYNLWHSSKIDYPDLNISGYKYGRVDIILEEARKETSIKLRKEKYLLFQKYMSADVPIVTLYEPVFELGVHDTIGGVDIDGISFPHDRFRNVSSWYVK